MVKLLLSSNISAFPAFIIVETKIDHIKTHDKKGIAFQYLTLKSIAWYVIWAIICGK